MGYLVPEICKGFCCIVDRDQPTLAAMISSYLSKVGEYLPIFEFPHATIGKIDGDEDKIDEHIITRSQSEEFSVFVANSIGRNGGCENLILAGLSAEQKSYLTFLDRYNVIEITTVDDAEFLLAGFSEDKANYFSCRPDEILEGLYQAVQTNSKLRIEDTATPLTPTDVKKEGLIVIENNAAVSPVIAVNYALSINAEIKVVAALADKEEKEISYLLQEWQKGSDARYQELSDKVHKRIGGVYFPSYEFATFFTEGLPYSLILHDVIPFSYVHLLYKPDFFIFDNLLFEKKQNINAAVVFSPQAFKDEETNYVIKSLQAQHLYVRELVGKSASVYNIDMHVKEFPYDLLHICSHGGEVNGYAMADTFKDRDGNTHMIEYDEVVSFAPNPDEKLIPVARKTIWRKFDGLVWGSKEFREAGYPHYVFADMQIEMEKLFNDKTHKQVRTPKAIVPDSCAIKCADFAYQAMIQVVAGHHTAPVIFNNSCWSAAGIADSFLAGGVRGYIGTLWKVNNQIATEVAETFYNHLFDGTVLDALQKGLEKCRGTNNEGIYIYWGLHFSTIQKGHSITESRENVCKALLRSFYRWTDHAKTVASAKIRDNVNRLADWNMRQLRQYFFWDYLKLRATWKAKQASK